MERGCLRRTRTAERKRTPFSAGYTVTRARATGEKRVCERSKWGAGKQVVQSDERNGLASGNLLVCSVREDGAPPSKFSDQSRFVTIVSESDTRNSGACTTYRGAGTIACNVCGLAL